jgi:hypothetical protein
MVRGRYFAVDVLGDGTERDGEGECEDVDYEDGCNAAKG